MWKPGLGHQERSARIWPPRRGRQDMDTSTRPPGRGCQCLATSKWPPGELKTIDIFYIFIIIKIKYFLVFSFSNSVHKKYSYF